MKRTLLFSFLIALFIVGAGCQLSNNGPTSPGTIPGDPAETVIDLDSPTGGFTYLDEEPAFGEPELYEPLMNEEEAEDAYQEKPEVRNEIRELECRRGVKIYRFRAIWGRLANAFVDSNLTECCPVDWTGTLHLDGGIIVIERIIAFEPGDYVTRIDRSTISWVSYTCPHVDGIQVRLIVPPGPIDSLANEIAPKLVFKTGPFSRTFDLEELEALNMVEPVDRCGNGISINSHIIPPYCPHGYLMGGWRKLEPDTTVVNDSTVTEKRVLGVFRGIWVSEHGLRAGYLRGVYGINSNNEHVFFGKYVDLRGRFRGILKGHYGPAPDPAAIVAPGENPYGWFHGFWIGRNEVVKGRLKGHWISDGPGHGYFHGIWGMNCSNKL